MYVNGARNIGVFSGFFHGSTDGESALYACEDRRERLPIVFKSGLATPADWQPINVAGSIAGADGNAFVEVEHWEPAGHNVLHNRMDWKVIPTPEEHSLWGTFAPINRPGFNLSDETKAQMVDVSSYGPAVTAALDDDENSREFILPALSRRVPNQVLLTGVVLSVARSPIVPEDHRKHPYYWGTFALGPNAEDIVDIRINSVSESFAGSMSRFRTGPTPVTLHARLCAKINDAGDRHIYLDCRSASLISARDFEGGNPPSWILLAKLGRAAA